LKKKPPEADEMALREHIQRIALEHRYYGYRRIGQALRTEGMVVNSKRVRRLLRLDNLLALRRKPLFRAAKRSAEHRIFPRLNERLELSGTDQLWVADLTYVALQRSFVYVAVVLDAYSRRAIGWSVGRSLQASVPWEALKMALAARQPRPGLVHHSDQGVQYGCRQYVELLRDHGILSSMSRAGCPYDNGAMESFMKTLKREGLRTRYQTIEELKADIDGYLNDYYNRQRMHSALDYRSPEQYELESSTSPLPAAMVS
jgi:putative transposase